MDAGGRVGRRSNGKEVNSGDSVNGSGSKSRTPWLTPWRLRDAVVMSGAGTNIVIWCVLSDDTE